MTAVDLNGATVIVTGASRGFGRATAVALAKSGAHVVGVARHRGGLEELQRELDDALNCETADVADPELPARLFDTYKPTAVVLNAGATPVIAPVDEQDWDTFSVNWNVDVRQDFHFVQQALRTPPPNGGAVVTMSSGAALGGSAMSGGYAGAKATVRFISSYGAAEAARRAIPVRFVSVLPHITNFGTGRLGIRAYAARAGITEEEFIERAGATATPDQVASHVLDVIADGSYSAPAYHLTSDGLRPLS
jgi:NAD(P)-dependent dehydrogenase (short-subunit alcohol dehydrogenase family)